jgi:serine phosphatase RsbU (regulator of sigma subunit)
LVAHDVFVHAEDTIASVYEGYGRHAHEFAAILDGGAVAGMCSRERLGLLLSQPFGRSLYMRRPVGESLLLPATVVRVTDPITGVLDKAFTRPAEEFFDDVLLVDEADRYVGMIPMTTLVRLQHGCFVDHIELLERQRRELNEKNAVMEQELHLAGQLQDSLLPPPASPPSALGYAYRLAPLGTVSGDCLFVLDAQPGRLGLLLCDVMGHGVRAALIAAMIRALVQRDARKDLAPGDILTRLNRDLAGLLRKDGAVIFVTASCLLADAGAREIRYALAGHHGPCRVGPGCPAHPLRPADAAAGPAIGLIEGFAYATSACPMSAGDRFLTFTDGLFEAAGPTGEEFGMDRLLEQFQRHESAEVDQMLDRVVEAVRAFAAPGVLADDVCLAALTYS